MKLSSDVSVLRFAHQGINNFACLHDFGKNVIENFPRVYKISIHAIEVDASNIVIAESSVAEGSVSSISVRRIITAINDAKHHMTIDRSMRPQNMEHASVFATFKIEHEAYLSTKDDDDSKVPKIDD